MRIKYKGGRSMFRIALNRKAYYFTKKNNRVLNIKEQEIINYIFSLSNRAEFEVVMEDIKVSEINPIVKEIESEPFKCTVCGFIAKSEYGLKVHSRKHKKEATQ